MKSNWPTFEIPPAGPGPEDTVLLDVKKLVDQTPRSIRVRLHQNGRLLWIARKLIRGDYPTTSAAGRFTLEIPRWLAHKLHLPHEGAPSIEPTTSPGPFVPRTILRKKQATANGPTPTANPARGRIYRDASFPDTP